jgi:hypothetical protein
MMNRQQRIDYEILDHVLNAGQADGYATNIRTFLLRLRELFPFIQAEEFVDACTRLHKDGQLELLQRDGLVYRPYLGVEEDPTFFIQTFYLGRAHLSHDYFQQLQGFIEIPAAPSGRGR